MEPHTGVFLPLRPGPAYEVELVFLAAQGDPGGAYAEWNRASLPDGALQCETEPFETIADVPESGPFRCRLTIPEDRIRQRVDALTLEPRDADLWLRSLTVRPLDD